VRNSSASAAERTPAEDGEMPSRRSKQTWRILVMAY
jgi:hypothetical protein